MAASNFSKPNTNIGWNSELCLSKPVFSARTVNLVDTQSIAFISGGSVITTETPPFVNASFFEFPLNNPGTRVAACIQTGSVVGTSFLKTTLPVPLAGTDYLSQVAFIGEIPKDAVTNISIKDGDFFVVWPEGTTTVTIVGLDVDVSAGSTLGTNTTSGTSSLPAVTVDRPLALDAATQTQIPAVYTIVPLALSNYAASSKQVAIVAHYQVPVTSDLLIPPS